jgi:hypothetical protein
LEKSHRIQQETGQPHDWQDDRRTAADRGFQRAERSDPVEHHCPGGERRRAGGHHPGWHAARSHHVKILQNAGLISTRKAGRNYYYSLRREVIEHLLDSLWELAPSPRPIIDSRQGSSDRRPLRRQDWAERQPTVLHQRAVNDSDEAIVLTW